MPECPICLHDIQADDTAFAHHVDGHFADEGSRDPPGAPIATSSSGVSRKRKGSFKDHGGDGLEECLICRYPLQSVSAKQSQDHINACLDAGDPREAAAGDGRIDDPLIYELNGELNGDETMLGRVGSAPGHDKGGSEGLWDGPARPGGWSDWVSRKMDKGDAWWDPVDGSTDERHVPPNWTPGALGALRQYLCSSPSSFTIHARLCSEVPHIRHSLRFDIGWGCGYRNALMAISALLLALPAYRDIFGRNQNGSDPGVRRIQGWIEEAWDAGFDKEGREQLKGKLLGTRKWIGTTELFAMFSYKGIPCQLVDFPKLSPRANTAARPPHSSLVQWVKRYFGEGHPPPAHDVDSGKAAFDVLMQISADGRENEDNIVQTAKLPIIIQHSGHSRLIVGYEETAKGTNLLIFDPGFSLSKNIRTTGLHHVQHSRPKSNLTSPRKPSHSSSHESIRFSRPYTNGASEPVLFLDNPIGLMEDEEIDDKGWVRKKIDKVNKAKYGAGVKAGNKSGPDLLSMFRVSKEKMARHKEYQLLVFLGGPVLPAEERARRKVVSSIRVT